MVVSDITIAIALATGFHIKIYLRQNITAISLFKKPQEFIIPLYKRQVK